MIKNGRVAVPSNGGGGLEATRSGHFGHCDVFTLVDVENNTIKDISILPNQEHVQGGCMVPVNLLSANRVSALIVGGIGMRPLMGFKQVGIQVFHDDRHAGVGDVITELLEGRLNEIRNDQVCGGGH